MSHLQTRYAELQAAQRVPLYGDGLTIVDANLAKNLLLKLGYQPKTGRFLYLLDLDGRNHGPSFDADKARAAFERTHPELARKIVWTRSRSQLGWWGWYETYQEMPTGQLHVNGIHVGELIGGHTFDPGNIEIPILTPLENEWLRDYFGIQGNNSKGERWADRAKQGARLTRGAKYIPVKLADLRRFLQNEAGPIGKQLDTYFDTDKPFNRSDKFGTLAQTLMLHARRLPGCANASDAVRCANAKAYLIASDAYGKAGEDGYDIDKDSDSLIAQIVNGDNYGPRDNPRQWRIPSWLTGALPAPAPEPEAPRPAHRPKGDQEKHLATFRRVLEAIEPDEFGRRTYTLDYLADKMKAAKCAVKPRTIQNYLKILRGKDNNGEIVTGQIDGNGRPYAILKPCFGGANNYQKRVEIAPESPAGGGANEIADERILTPQTAETPPQCKEDHQNPSAPAVQPAEWAGIDEELAAFVPPPAAPPRVREWDRAESWAAAELANERYLAAQASKPRQAAPIQFGDLPERPVLRPHWPDWVWGWDPPPQGRSSFGAPLPAGIVERLQRLKAEREAAHG